MIAEGHIPGGTNGNQLFVEDWVSYAGNIPANLRTLLCDAQTSGGLLIAVEAAKCNALITRLNDYGVPTIQNIGEVGSDRPGKIEVM